MKRLLILLIALMAAGFVACKGAVTETPNPCPGGSCAVEQPGGGDDGGGNDPTVEPSQTCDDTAAALLVYANAAYGVTVDYPACWSVAEKTAGNASGGVAAQALFSRSSADCPVEPVVEVTIGRLKSGESLVSLAEAGSCDAGAVSVGALSGSYCDLLTGADRGSGIALRERYALAHGGAVYVVVSVVACEEAITGVERILENITIP